MACTEDIIHLSGWLFPHEFTAVDNFKLVGGGQTLLLHQNSHVTINADGTVTSVIDNPILECK